MKRRRGATFTVIVLLASALLLAIGGAFADSSRHLVELGGLREHRARTREALAGAAAWARCAVAAGEKPGTTTLELSRVTVTVTLKAAEGGDAYFMDATASADGVSQRATASVARRDGRWALTRFELVEGQPGAKAQPEKKKRAF